MSYTIEILPYPLRAKGFNVFNFVISLALIFNQYVNPIALAAIAWKYYVSSFTSVLVNQRLLTICFDRFSTAAGSWSSSSSCTSSSWKPRTAHSKRPLPCSMGTRLSKRSPTLLTTLLEMSSKIPLKKRTKMLWSRLDRVTSELLGQMLVYCFLESFAGY